MQLEKITGFEIGCKCNKMTFKLKIEPKDIKDSQFLCPLCGNDMTRIVVEATEKVNAVNQASGFFENLNALKIF